MRPGIALIRFLVCLLAGIWIACAGLPAEAATTERIVVNRFSGVAIEGFDPVSYFVDGAAVWAEAGTIQPASARSATAARRDAKFIKEPLVSIPVRFP